VFSTRVPDDRRPNDLARALAGARARGPIIDLPVSNPTRVGIEYPPDLLAGLSDRAALTYQPASRHPSNPNPRAKRSKHWSTATAC
jgi:hypothetical protein